MNSVLNTFGICLIIDIGGVDTLKVPTSMRMWPEALKFPLLAIALIATASGSWHQLHQSVVNATRAIDQEVD